MKDQATLTNLLRNAHHCVDFKGLLPEGFHVEVGSHSTGCQPRITVESAGLPSLKVWEGSVWYSSSYNFNDREKTLGVQPDCQFAFPILEKFFSDLEEAYEQYKIRYEQAKLDRLEQEKQQRKDTIAAYAKVLTA